MLVGVFKNKPEDLKFISKEFATSDDGDFIEEEEFSIEESDEIIIHLDGAVRNPGIIRLRKGERVIDAIEKSGGLLEGASLKNINLAQKLEDEEKIYIYTTEEMEKIEDRGQEDLGENNGEKININLCSKEELKSLPGIGDVIANRIIEYRQEKKFSKKEDIMEISGIGTKKYEDLKDLIEVN